MGVSPPTATLQLEEALAVRLVNPATKEPRGLPQ